MDSLVEKDVLQDSSAYVNELELNSEFKTTSMRKKLVEQHLQWKKEAYKVKKIQLLKKRFWFLDKQQNTRSIAWI